MERYWLESAWYDATKYRRQRHWRASIWRVLNHHTIICTPGSGSNLHKSISIPLSLLCSKSRRRRRRATTCIICGDNLIGKVTAYKLFRGAPHFLPFHQQIANLLNSPITQNLPPVTNNNNSALPCFIKTASQPGQRTVVSGCGTLSRSPPPLKRHLLRS